jgi:cyclophilin family peptidyl-prolyl cis-trans isomerase
VLKKKEVLCYLDIDIDGARTAHKLAKEFVEATDITYGWSSKWLHELGGSEKSRIPDMFAADYEWSQKGKIQLEPPVERVVVKVIPAQAPLAAENFVALCDGFKGKSSNTGKPLHYKGCPYHRIVNDFVAQTGDIATGTVLVFRQKLTLECGIGFHACSPEASMRVTYAIPPTSGVHSSYRLTLSIASKHCRHGGGVRDPQYVFANPELCRHTLQALGRAVKASGGRNSKTTCPG